MEDQASNSPNFNHWLIYIGTKNELKTFKIHSTKKDQKIIAVLWSLKSDFKILTGFCN